jgi:predicted ATPase
VRGRGIGKTRLALQVLAAAADSFPDGAWFVELGDLQQPDLVVPRVASVIGVSEEPWRPLLETLADAVRPRRLLLALDNCEHLIEACARVCQRLLASSPGLRLIATSREPLRVAAERVWQVPPLSVAPDGAPATAEQAERCEAMRLFADRAAASLPGFAIGPANAAAVAALCRALDGIPLAIELAAARVRALSVEQIAARLADRFALLTIGERTAPPRHRTLRATARCAPPSTGAMSCSRTASRCCCGGCRSSPAGRWRWPSRCAPMTASRPGTYST